MQLYFIKSEQFLHNYHLKSSYRDFEFYEDNPDA
jgi:hypothetical protein